jgi:hypothetical protein
MVQVYSRPIYFLELRGMLQGFKEGIYSRCNENLFLDLEDLSAHHHHHHASLLNSSIKHKRGGAARAGTV